MKDFSVPVGLDAKVKIDLVVVGSVAVSEKGNTEDMVVLVHIISQFTRTQWIIWLIIHPFILKLCGTS